MSIQNFQSLLAWQKAHEFAISIYELTNTFPRQELFGLTSQIRRASVSVCANIAEGFKRYGLKDQCRFFNIAAASLEEVRAELLIARDLNFCARESAEKILGLAEATAMLIGGLQRRSRP